MEKMGQYKLKQIKELARNPDLSMKEIAARVGVCDKSVRRWLEARCERCRFWGILQDCERGIDMSDGYCYQFRKEVKKG